MPSPDAHRPVPGESPDNMCPEKPYASKHNTTYSYVFCWCWAVEIMKACLM